MGAAISDSNQKALFSDTKGQSLSHYFHLSLPSPSLTPIRISLNSHCGWAFVCVCTTHSKPEALYSLKLLYKWFVWGILHNHLHISRTGKISTNSLTKSSFQTACRETEKCQAFLLSVFFYLLFLTRINRNWLRSCVLTSPVELLMLCFALYHNTAGSSALPKISRYCIWIL